MRIRCHVMSFMSCAPAFHLVCICEDGAHTAQEKQKLKRKLRNKRMRAASRPPAPATSVTLAEGFR